MSRWNKYVEALSDKDVMKKMKSFKKVNGSKPTFDSVLEVLEKFPWLVKAKFKDAEVSVDKYNELVWEDGDWEDGTWKGGFWENGYWENGTWVKGRWEYGEWLNGTWKDGVWKDGVWNDGTWFRGEWWYGTWYDGTWKKGKWIMGYDADAEYHDKGDSPDNW